MEVGDLEKDGFDDTERLLEESNESNSEAEWLIRKTPWSTGRDRRWKYCQNVVLLVAAMISICASVLGIVTLLYRKDLIPVPQPPSYKACRNPIIRREWRQLSLDERHAYLASVRCLTTKPSKLGLNTTLYDDFTYVHIQLKYQIHHVAMSLPWHRYFLHVYEQTLRDECGYDGYMPYWDWTLDVTDPLKSPIWFPSNGFAGNASSVDGCVHGGPLDNIRVNYTEYHYAPHCLTRSFDLDSEEGPMHRNQFTPAIIEDLVTSAPTYQDFRQRLESGPHKHVHRGIGGEMPKITSTNDPVFFVHHTQIDRLWWLWQQRDPETRNDEFFGPFGLDDSSVVVSGASLTDAIIMLGLAEDRVVSKLMKTESEILCYRYEIQKQAKITEMETTIVPDPLSPDRHRCLGQSRTSREG